MKNLFIYFCILLAANLLMAEDSERHQQVDGMSVYLGVIPAQLIQGHAGMHGGGVKDEHHYHILVALFDNSSGERITDAKVKATVSALGMQGKTKELEPMKGELLSYGNYFIMDKSDLYRIRVEILRDENGRSSVAKFIFHRPKN